MYSGIKSVIKLRQHLANVVFKDFIKVFEEIVAKNHEGMDASDDHDYILRLQGSNRTLKKLIKELTQELKEI